jgi:hypothetical protein
MRPKSKVMARCEMELPGLVLALCDEPASIEIEGHHFCAFHAGVIEAAEERWSGINWFSFPDDDMQEQARLDPEGKCWDD